ncbi:MAG TPA: ABC transporter substrate-binding protein [Chthonomonadaceae bacterium]|nr:ABC transporter substrate-binding protein [Chthonomonadaceae bacterium]
MGALLGLAGCHASTPANPTAAAAPQTAAKPHPRIGVITPPPTTPFPRTLTDARGQQITLPKPPQCIVSLAPSNTEILYALDLGNRLVADTTACDYPPEARKKPHVGGYAINIEAVQVQNPDLVVAVGSVNGQAIKALERTKTPLLVIDPKTVADVYDAIKLIGAATGQDMQAARVVMEMQARIDAIKRAVASTTARPRVFIVYGVKPTIYTTGPGSFIDDLITVAGGKNIVTTPAPAGNTISAEQVVTAQPDVIIASKGLIPQIRQMPGWATGVPAVRNNRFFTPGDGAILERPGPRLAEGAEELAKYLHPEIFDRSKP